MRMALKARSAFSVGQKLGGGLVRQIFGLDLRSLALFRVAIGLVIIADLIDRGQDLTAHYTDIGLLPRTALIQHFMNTWGVCLHLVTGTFAGMAVLFVLQGWVAFLLAIGYRTRLMAVVSWFLMYSLHLRNGIILQGGDDLLRMLLFWGMFLPLGARYSVDAALAKNGPVQGNVTGHPNQIFSVATVATLGQILILYWMSALLKTGVEWHAEGSAVYYALSFEQLSTRTGLFLLQFPAILPMLTHVTLFFEGFGPFLLLSPFRFGPLRTLGAFMFMGMHHSFALCLMLGMFPWIDMTSMLILLPAWFWVQAERLMPAVAQRQLTVYYDAECDLCKKLVLIFRELLVVPHITVATAQSNAKIHALMQREGAWVVHDGTTAHTAWAGFIALCRVSPWARVVAPLGMLPGFRQLGRVLYYSVAGRRAPWARLSAEALPWREQHLGPNSLASLVALGLFLVIATWNAASVSGSPVRFPDALRPLTYMLRIDQNWGMFAPQPQRDDGWYILPGTLVDGSDADVYRHREAIVSLDKPAVVSDMYSNQRWSKYMMNIWVASNEAYRLYFGQYLCRLWNGAENRHLPKSLAKFEIAYMREDNLPDGKVKPAEKVTLWQHYCFDVPAKP